MSIKIPRSASLPERRLLLRRRELQATLDALGTDLAGLVLDTAEMGDTDFSEDGGDPDVVAFERDRVRAQAIHTREHLDAVDQALAAVADGTYGTCRVCGATIPDERLEALPDTSLCVACKAGGH